MKYVGFSFKNEAIWMLIFSIAPVTIALLVILIGVFLGGLLGR
jgi:hypothetical protein